MDLTFNPYLAFSWCVLAGFMMSMGAGGGGILAGIGHISILGIGDANMIKVVNQILEFSSRIVSVPLYHRQKRLVWSLALSFGLGAPIGAIAGSWISKAYLSDMAVYRSLFGLLVAFVAARVLYEGWGKAMLTHAGLRKAQEASDRVAKSARAAGATSPSDGDAPCTTHFGRWMSRVRFGGEHFEFNPMAAAAGGFAISFIGSMLGVGGGFLVTPFMASLLLFPMYLVVGTSLVALMIPLTVSVLTYIALQVNIDWRLVAIEVPGVLAGSFLGPLLNRYMNEKALKTFVAVVLLAIGVHYVLF
ncbi:MAG: sulfite exporter TauE/SafE family protein [Betaproteobacteria bacterium]|nr:sulfite exporter TauE/SafE family protein [Betaproteobacteria bacterium]